MELSGEEKAYLSRLVYGDKAGDTRKRADLIFKLNDPESASKPYQESGFSSSSGPSGYSGRSGDPGYSGSSCMSGTSQKPFIGLSGISGFVPHGVKKPGYKEMPPGYVGPKEGGVYSDFKLPSGQAMMSQEREWKCLVYSREQGIDGEETGLYHGPIERTIYAANESSVLMLLVPITKPGDAVDVSEVTHDGYDRCNARATRYERTENGWSDICEELL